MKVHEIMTGHARFVAPDTSLVEAAGLMRELDVGVLPVCDGDVVAGILTDRDIVVRGIADGLDPNEARVSDVMSGPVESVRPDDDVEAAARIMEQHQIRRLPVLDSADRLVGIVALGDIAMSSNPAFGGMALRDVSQPSHPNARQRRLARASNAAQMPWSAETRRGPQAGRVPAARRRSDSAGAEHSGSAQGEGAESQPAKTKPKAAGSMHQDSMHKTSGGKRAPRRQPARRGRR